MTELWLFFMALAVVYLLPGPDMILLLQTGARQGKGAALATALGLGVARGCHVALAALGLATLFRTAPWTFDVVRLAGAAYLLWIGIQCLRTTMLPSLNGADATTAKPRWPEAIQRGLLTNLLNPKALLFCSVLLPQFQSVAIAVGQHLPASTARFIHPVTPAPQAPSSPAARNSS